MKFYRLDQVPVSRDDQVFKESPTINAVAVVILFGLTIAALVFKFGGWKIHGSSPGAFFYFVAGFCALIGLFPLFNFRASLKPSNWLLRCQLSGFFVKYRAYENWRLPADALQVVGFDYGEIAWAKIVKERRTTPSTDSNHSTQTEWRTYVDLGLVNPDTSELEANLAAERNLRPDGAIVILDYPVQVLPGGIVEIRWTAGIRPSATKALQALGCRIKILEVEHRKTDLTHHRGANPDDEKPKIIALLKSGDHFGAVKLTRSAYGYSLSQAEDFIDQLESTDPQPPK